MLGGESTEELDKLLSKKLAVDPLLLQELQELLLVLGAGVKLSKIFMPKPQGVKSLGLRFGYGRLSQRFNEAGGSQEGTFLLRPQFLLCLWRAKG